MKVFTVHTPWQFHTNFDSTSIFLMYRYPIGSMPDDLWFRD